MLAELELDYVQHLERGYCANHPDVVAGTKEQVLDRATKQLLEALQANGFELDGNVLKRGAGWLRYDADTSAWQFSNDAGVTWLPFSQGKPFFGLRNPTFNSGEVPRPDVTGSKYTFACVVDLDFTLETGESILYHLKNTTGATIVKFGYDHANYELFVYLGSARYACDYINYQKICEMGFLSDPSNNQIAFFDSGLCFTWMPVTPSYPELTTTAIEVIGPIHGDLYWMALAPYHYHTPGIQGHALRRGRSQFGNPWRYWGLQEGHGTILTAHKVVDDQDITYTLTAGAWIGVEE